MLALLVTAAAICALSLVIGRAACVLAGVREWSWLAPAVGLATLLVTSAIAIRLPGHGVTARLTVLALALASVAVLARRPGARPPAADTAGVAAALLLLTLVPFAVNGRVGVLGVLNNADFAGHLVLADALLSGPPPAHLFYGAGYPSGPHALAAALTGLGTDVKDSLGALLIAVPIITGWTALAALGGLPRAGRLVAATLVGLPYLAAAYYVQASFKEPIQALVVLAFTLGLATLPRPLGTRAAGLLGLLAGASLVSYSLAGLAWPAGIVLCWGTIVLIRRAGLPRLDSVRRAAVPVGVLAATLLSLGLAVGIDPLGGDIERVEEISRGATTGGNIFFPIAPSELSGVWLRDDFRFRPGSLESALLAAVALLAGALAALWWLRRGELLVPAALGLCLVLYAQARYLATPYYDAKALVIAAPLAMLLITRAALEGEGGSRARRRPGAGAWTVGRRVVAGAFLAAALASTALALMGARVLPEEHADELARLRPIVRDRATLFIGHDDYSIWDLRGARLSTVTGYVGNSQVPFAHRPTKPFKSGSPVEFDSFDQGSLDRFDYIVAPRSAYLDPPAGNWRRASETRSYYLWRRQGPTPDRDLLAAGSAFGATLDCGRRPLRKLSQREGAAGTRARPVVGGAERWRSEGGRSLPLEEHGFAVAAAGEPTRYLVTLPPGLWDLSLQYQSPTALEVIASGGGAELPPLQEEVGPYWVAGRLRSRGGSNEVRVTAADLPPFARRRTVLLGGLAATRAGAPERTVTLRRACGRYVTWYSVAPAARAGAHQLDASAPRG